jgi:hypothetical protein
MELVGARTVVEVESVPPAVVAGGWDAGGLEDDGELLSSDEDALLLLASSAEDESEDVLGVGSVDEDGADEGSADEDSDEADDEVEDGVGGVVEDGWAGVEVVVIGTGSVLEFIGSCVSVCTGGALVSLTCDWGGVSVEV